ncbi:hypothetical protein [Conservatibacter flavescens]|uniref:Uncharacterized protein n=1 Tax=Conservatibacter flavescens TaxID=28161 RepID=A0A2M8S2W1_9PAST|nr:hypothetical protein [Conservatibacter flavescens]PJG85472.1 hypothetical protein CVP05_05910 [Conservatibacter flavescens]
MFKEKSLPLSTLLKHPTGQHFTLVVGNLPATTFQVTDFPLTEGYNRLFELDIHAASLESAVDFGEILDNQATFCRWQNGVQEDSITDFRFGEQVRPTDVVLKDYTFKHPNWAAQAWGE